MTKSKAKKGPPLPHEVERFNVVVPREVGTKLRLEAARSRKQLGTIVAEALEAWLSRAKGAA